MAYTHLHLIEFVKQACNAIGDKINSIWHRSLRLLFSDTESMLLFFHNRNTGSFLVYMDELPNFTPAFEGNFT